MSAHKKGENFQAKLECFQMSPSKEKTGPKTQRQEL